MVNILEVQQRLLKLGYNPGPIDGIAGRRTTAAVAEFQKAVDLDIMWPGTIGPKTLKALAIQNVTVIEPPWMTLAQHKLGLHETRNNKELSAFLKSDGAFLGDPSKLPWCGDFVETCIAVSLPNEVMISNPYWALNWLKFGEEISIDKPLFGAILVAVRDGGGHVAFVVGHDELYFHVIGGNQSNTVSIMKISKKRVKGLRVPTTFEMTGPVLKHTVFNGKVSYNEA